MFRLHAAGCGIAFALAAAGLFAGPASAQTAKVPNLVALPAKDISLQPSPTVENGWLIRFTTVSWNKGTGPLELVAGDIDTDAQKRKVNQRIYNTDGTHTDVFAGSFVWHPAHNHFHFERYATYTLQPINAPGGSMRQGAKTTFCVMDTDHINSGLAGSPSSAYYATCGNAVQGMSVGWGDTYGSHLAGQSLDFTGQPDGLYQL
ncbi:MAG TPA: lysyl oxidase family protein, partial [Nevskiaceae bacterium]|nr:lysyl oxidase family protein [Nevskiaceae bacterium]